MRVVEQLGALGSSCVTDPVTGKFQCWPLVLPPKVCAPGDYACAGVNPPWMVTRPGSTAQPMTAALPSDWTRFALGAAAGAAAILILWRLK